MKALAVAGPLVVFFVFWPYCHATLTTFLGAYFQQSDSGISFFSLLATFALGLFVVASPFVFLICFFAQWLLIFCGQKLLLKKASTFQCKRVWFLIGFVVFGILVFWNVPSRILPHLWLSLAIPFEMYNQSTSGGRSVALVSFVTVLLLDSGLYFWISRKMWGKCLAP